MNPLSALPTRFSARYYFDKSYNNLENLPQTLKQQGLHYKGTGEGLGVYELKNKKKFTDTFVSVLTQSTKNHTTSLSILKNSQDQTHYELETPYPYDSDCPSQKDPVLAAFIKSGWKYHNSCGFTDIYKPNPLIRTTVPLTGKYLRALRQSELFRKNNIPDSLPVYLSTAYNPYEPKDNVIRNFSGDVVTANGGRFFAGKFQEPLTQAFKTPPTDSYFERVWRDL